jgi:Chemotaxis protein histidine kinase and related kinases
MDPLLDELEDRVEQIFSATEKLHNLTTEGRTARQLLDSIFRNVHSLKASAASNNLNELALISHEFENLLHSLRVGKTQMTDQVLRAFDDTADAMFSSLHSQSAGPVSHPALIDRLRALSEGTPGDGFEVDVTADIVPAKIWKSLSEDEKHRLKQVINEGASLFQISVSLDAANFDKQFQSLKNRLTAIGELISTAPALNADNPDKVDFRILYASECDHENLNQRLPGLDNTSITEISAVQSTVSPQSQRQQNLKTVSRSLRIELDDLDQLISSTQQLFRKTNDCLSTASGRIPELQVESISASFMKLAADLVDLRMVPIDRILQRAYRAGRSAAVAAGKQIEFEVIGGEIKIDKALSDAIADPLIHLVRNAVDHGIETEPERLNAGKDRKGKIRIEASTLQGRTTIKVSDNGRGIDSESICTEAKRLNLIAEDARIDLELSVRLIFRAGFSTASDVSEVSGRGVGLNVVETTIEELGGTIRVKSTPGVGSVFEILLPVTFSLLNAVVVRSARFHYLIDTKHVVSSEAIDEAPIDDKTQQPFNLDELLGFDGSDIDTNAQLICRVEDSKVAGSIALRVNEVIGTEQVLVRSLGSRGGRWLGVAGAAEMRDGTVALLLDLPALIETSVR